MKRVLYSVCIGGLALAVTAWGEQVNNTTTVRSKARARGRTVQSATGNHATERAGGNVRPHGYISTAPARQRTYRMTRQTNSASVVNRSNLRSTHVQTFRGQNVRSANKVRARNDVTSNRARNISVNRDRNVTLNRQRNVTVNNNWRSGRFSGQSYAAFRNYHREWHDRGWWRSHYNRIVFVDGGWYYWNVGYWFPAWGYDPYAYYSYDGPIYGYKNLAPDQVIVDVQTQLQRDGYYAGPVDGVLGSMTRQAITAFQADHGLAVTSTIDEPTLETLGLS